MSERFYVKRYAAEWQQAKKGQDDSFASLHPQFARLVQCKCLLPLIMGAPWSPSCISLSPSPVHGLPEEALLSSTSTSSSMALKNRLLCIQLANQAWKTLYACKRRNCELGHTFKVGAWRGGMVMFFGRRVTRMSLACQTIVYNGVHRLRITGCSTNYCTFPHSQTGREFFQKILPWL